jgi:hypothetical protein
MLRTSVVRRAGRLLGAVTVTGILSAGLLAASPLAADASVSSYQANGIGNAQYAKARFHIYTDFDANGI